MTDPTAPVAAASPHPRGGRRRLLALGLAALTLLPGCTRILSEKDAATALVDRYYAALATGPIDGALAFYGEPFYAETPRERWAAVLADLVHRCGAPREHVLASWHVTTRICKNAGATAELAYKVDYEHCSMTEQVIVTAPDGGVRAISAHQLKPLDGPAPASAPTGALST